jgi:hypothetical protein
MSSIQSRAMLVTLSIGMFSPRKTDKKVTREVIDQHNAADSAGKFVKQLLPEEALEQIKKLQNEARTWHYANTCPWTDEGLRILPCANSTAYMAKMREFRQKFEAHMEVFLSKYEDFKNTARSRLNGMFNEDDYPGLDAVRRRFNFKTAILPFPDGADFRVDVADEEMAELKAQMDKRIAEAKDLARRDLWLRLAEPLQTMARNLSNPKAKIYDTVVSNVQDIIGLIPVLNVTGDGDLGTEQPADHLRVPRQQQSQLWGCAIGHVRRQHAIRDPRSGPPGPRKLDNRRDWQRRQHHKPAVQQCRPTHAGIVLVRTIGRHYGDQRL